MRHDVICPGWKKILMLGVICVFVAGCINNLPPSAWRYSPNGPGTQNIETKYSVMVVAFEEGNDFEGIRPYEHPFGPPGMYSEENISGGGLESPPRRFAKWLASELEASEYFKSVQFFEWTEAAEQFPNNDIVVSGRIKRYYTKDGPHFFWVLPPQSLLFLTGVLFGLPVVCRDHEFEIEVHVSHPMNPLKTLWSKSYALEDKDLGCSSPYAKGPNTPINQVLASHQKNMLRKVYLDAREEIVRELQPGGKIYTELKKNVVQK